MRRLAFVILALALASCTKPVPDTAPNANWDDESNLPAEVVVLRRFLDVPYEKRVRSAMADGDHRYLAVGGIGLTLPCGPRGPWEEIDYLMIPGTTDALESPEHGYLNEHARLYACLYNRSVAEALRLEDF